MKYQKLGQHILQIRGISFKPEDVITEQLDGYVPVIKSNNITETGFDSKGLIYIKSEYIRPEQFIRNGDLVLTASSGSKKTIGKNIQFDSDYNGSFGAFCKLIRPKSTINPKYIYHYFKTHYFRDSIEKAVQGANIANLKNEYINDLQIPLPPLDDQIRIAAVLTRAEKLIAKRKGSINALDEFLKSTFLEMFGDPVRNEKGWNRKPLSEILEKIESGWSPICLDRPALDGEWGVLKLGAVTKCIYDPLENKALPETESPEPSIEVHKGDVLFSRKNTYELVAACAYVWHTPPKLMLSDLIFRLVLRNEKSVNPIYLQALLSFSSKRKTIQKLAGGAAGSMPNISKSRLLLHLVECPSLPLQSQFANIAKKVEGIKYRYKQSLYELENLYGSLSQLAFKGELKYEAFHVHYGDNGMDKITKTPMPCSRLFKPVYCDSTAENIKTETILGSLKRKSLPDELDLSNMHAEPQENKNETVVVNGNTPIESTVTWEEHESEERISTNHLKFSRESLLYLIRTLQEPILFSELMREAEKNAYENHSQPWTYDRPPHYDDICNLIFELLDEGILFQAYNKDKNQMFLTLTEGKVI
ncbi:MAG TPA: hypothetical protein DET40_08865 [Lentisphaeria bacterium]|nr:MAG: hypothetical protein A2X45_19540 [Lentisphaerae bacterium GWF2_50_93]HCE43646.1 hypothetical protein [Lentisphaeria bacterium]